MMSRGATCLENIYLLSPLLEEHFNSHHFTKQNDLIRKEYKRLRLRFVDYL
jgi:hypothetical protein